MYLAIHKKTVAKMKHSGEQLIKKSILIFDHDSTTALSLPTPTFPIIEVMSGPLKFLTARKI